MLPPGEATEHTAPSSTLSGTQADSDFFDGLYICTAKLVRGIPIVTTILRPCTGASSSSSSALPSDQGSSEDYPKIGVNTCGSSTDISRLIFMVAPNEDQPCHSSSGYPTIGRSEIINAFRDGVSDIKTVEEIAMKKPKTVADLLSVTDVCIEASEARARLLESRGKEPARRKDDREVNTAERGDRKDRRDQGFRGK
jgi:hypothetical protein